MMQTLVDILLHPSRALALDLRGWDHVIRLARSANVLGRLGFVLQRSELLPAVPPPPRQHLLAALALCERQAVAVEWEIEKLKEALRPLDLPLVLLKGAAYLAAASPAAHGRLFADIDILVPHARLDEVESALMLHGWHTLPLSRYDQHYYRQWMHELPPMTHRQRGGGLDVHHNILPRTARLRPDPQALLEGICPTADPHVSVLAPEDRLIHSACHWYFESEHRNGLRDILDIATLLQEFSTLPDFGARLEARARQLGLLAPLSAALASAHHCGLIPFAPGVLSPDLTRACRHANPRLLAYSLIPDSPLLASRTRTLARALLYLRGHWLRMPAHLLLPHLARKALFAEKT